MALQFVGQAALGSCFQVLFEQLGPILRSQHLCNFWGVGAELKRLEKKLLTIEVVLNDAEAKIDSEKNVKIWMNDLRELAYDMEDILDEMNTERLCREQEASNQAKRPRLEQEASNQASDNLVGHFKTALSYAKESTQKFQFKTNIKGKISEVLRRLDVVAKDADHLGLKEMMGLSSIPNQTRLRPETSPLVDESEVYGREKDKEKIIEELLASNDKYSVIPIVGMGGIGKTTVAQLVYNDERVKKHFELQSWACVSDVFDVARVTKELIECAKKKECPNMSLAALQLQLQDMIKDKKCLLVLDDIWTDKNYWNKLKAPFNDCANGSKVLVTTRDRKIANGISKWGAYELGNLEDKHCWNLFKEKAFQGVDAYTNGNLENIGMEIVKKCKGVPLAVMVMGGILQGAAEEKWEWILKNELWQVVDDNDEIFPALRMSYHCLPSPLKRCFEYLSLFPTWLNKYKLVRMWIAEGFVEAKEGRLLEDIGSEYYDEIKKRSLIQNNDRMHDLVHSLSHLVSKEFYWRVTNNTIPCQMQRIRYASLPSYVQVKEKEKHLLLQAKSLRTILGRATIGLERFSEWGLLRVLELKVVDTTILSCIGNLKHLRYLDLSAYRKVKNLPDSVCKLYNLQTLDLSDCYGFNILPKDMGNLKNLRYLNFSTALVSTLPTSICKLRNLLILNLSRCRSLIDVPEDIGNLSSLREFDLSYCSALEHLPHSICKLHNLKVLNLEYCHRLSYLPEGMGDLQNLRKLILKDASIPSLPESLCKLRRLEVLNLDHCIKLSHLPKDIGDLRTLEELDLSGTSLSLPNSFVKFDSEWSVDNKTGRRIGELKDINNLQGSLIISNLENIKSVEEASTADLKRKKHINELTFQWSPFLPKNTDSGDSSSVVRDGEVELKVLEALEPHSAALTSLSFINYNGDIFPKWMFVDKFSFLELLEMKGLDKIRSLVGLNLPSLLKLVILECPSLTDVSIQPPKLKQLSVEGCQELIELSLVPSIQDIDSYANFSATIDLPQLQELVIDRCSNLRQIWMAVPMLKELKVEECKELDIILPLRPLEANYKKLSLQDDSKSRIHSSLLDSLSIWSCPNLREVSMAVPKLENLSVGDCAKLNISLTLVSCLGWLTLADLNITSLRDLMNGLLPSTLEGLAICNCQQLESLFERGQQLPNLRSLEISKCDKLRLLALDGPPQLDCPELWNLSIDYSSQLQVGEVAPSLPGNGNASSFPMPWLRNLTSLWNLEIIDFPPHLLDRHDAFPPALAYLTFRRCTYVTSLPKALHNLTSITGLSVYDCPQLVTLTEGNEGLPPMLETLDVDNCPQLVTLTDGNEGLPPTLESLYVSACSQSQLVALREEGLPPALKRLSITRCPNLRYLPKDLYKFTSLYELVISDCPQLEARPDDRLPPNLKYVTIGNCTKLKQQLQVEDRRDWLRFVI